MSTNTEEMSYDLSAVLDVDALAAVDPGTSILVSGPAMTGKQDLVMELLADGARQGQGAVAVSTGDDAGAVIDDLQRRAPDADPGLLGAIDCRADGNEGGESAPGDPSIHHVGSPGDLTGIGIGITNCFDQLEADGVSQGRLALVSLSTMLTYTDKQTVFKFCHVVSSRLDAAGYLGAFTIDSSAHDAQTLQVIKQAFDAMIEIREEGGAREARVMGVQPDPSDWIEL
ncbi:RAD55 family ATPase [Halobacteriales archaeon Cl-PHB]